MKRTNFISILHHTIKTIREAVANLFFIGFIILLAITMQFIIAGLKITKPSLPKEFTLMLAPQIVKEEVNLPSITEVILSNTSHNAEMSIHDLTRIIRIAKDDQRVKAIWLNLDGFIPMGFGVVEEFYQALKEFKQSDKPLYVYASYYGKMSYFIASLADAIWLDPFGKVDINGFSSSQLFMADALSIVGVEANVIKMGRYKNAPEGYELNDRSQSNQEMTESLLASIWEHYLTTIMLNRPRLSDQQKIAIANPSLANRMIAKSEAESAHALGLIDHVGSQHQALNTIFSANTFDDFGTYTARTSDAVIDYYQYLEFNEKKQKESSSTRKIFSLNPTPTIAIIHASGAIVSGYGNKDQMGSSRIREQIESAVKDNVQAIVLRVDSGGGDAYASEEVYRLLMQVRSNHNIPIIISMAEVAASGAYWISLAGDEIIAHPSTITGSMGVFSIFFTAEEFAKRWGLNESIITVPQNTLSYRGSFNSMTQEFKDYHQASTNFIYEEFLQRLIQSERASSLEEANSLAQGRVYSGLQAHQLGLVDSLGYLETAIERASILADISDNYQVVFYTPTPSAVEQFMSALLKQSYSPVDLILSQLGLTMESLQKNPTTIYALEPMRLS